MENDTCLYLIAVTNHIMQTRLNILLKTLILDMICYLLMLQWVRSQSQKFLKNTDCVTVSIMSMTKSQ